MTIFLAKEEFCYRKSINDYLLTRMDLVSVKNTQKLVQKINFQTSDDLSNRYGSIAPVMRQ